MNQSVQQGFRLALVLVLLGAPLMAADIYDGFSRFGEKGIFEMQKKAGAEKPWPTVSVLAKWVGSREELLEQLTSPVWVAEALRRREVKVEGRCVAGGGIYSTKFPIIGGVDIPVKQTVCATDGGFLLRFECLKFWLAEFHGKIQVSELPAKDWEPLRTVAIPPPEQFLVRLTVQVRPKFPFARRLTSVYLNCVDWNFHMLLTQHTRDFARKHCPQVAGN